MANGYFVVQNGLQVGPLTIDASTGTINTSGDVSITGNLGVSQISKNDSSVSINDTGSSSTVVIKVDGTTIHTIDANGVNLGSGDYYSIDGTSVLNSTTLGSGVLASSLTSLGVITSLNATTAVAGNFSTANTRITGGYIQNLANVTAATSYLATLNTTAGNATTLVATNFSSANTQVTGGTITGLTNLTATTAQATNFSSANAQITAGTFTTLVAPNFTSANAHITGSDTNIGANHDNSISRINLVVGTTGDITTLVAPNFSSANTQITGGTITGLVNLTSTTERATNFSSANAQITAGTFTTLVAPNFSSANTQVTGGTITGLTNLTATTAQATNFSSGNIVATGGSVNNVTVGATTPTTGRFTTVTATTVNAGTIGNAGATLTGTISTATQNSVTTMAGLVSLGSNNIDTVAQGNFTIAGNLTVQGVNQAIGSQNLTVADSIIELHTYANLAPLTFDDGRDIGIRFHYYKGADRNAVLIWENTTEQLHWYANAVETSSNISGTLGTMGVGELFAGNATVSTSTGTGALRVTGGAGIGGAAYIGSTLNVASTSIFSGATNHAAGITASTVQAGTIGNASAVLTGTLSTAAQTNITSVGTLTGLTVSGAIVPNANLTINVGSTSAWFNTFYGVSTQAKYADLAENYMGDKSYAPGTVVMFGGAQEVTVADAETTAVAGVVSTNPAHLMNGQLTGATVIPLALQGRVPCMVIGPIKKGDMLVSAGFGYAKASASPHPGQVIGKALQDYPAQGKAVIEVVVGRV